MASQFECVRPGDAQRDDGFTLIEVIVSLVLLAMVAAAVLLFFVRGMQATSHVQRSQSADVVATEAMERVRSVSPQAVNASGTNLLVAGRAKSDVQAVWAAAASADKADSSILGIAGAIKVWDPSVTVSTTATLPIVASVDQSGIHYTVTTLIGRCYRLPSSAGANVPCTPTNPGSAVEVYRATVVVTWKPTTKDKCGGTTLCTYRMSTVLDPSADSSWNLTTKPVAYDDEFKVTVGDPAAPNHQILHNDMIGSYTANPVIALSTPTLGSASTVNSGPASSLGELIYTPPTAASGMTGVTYKLRDAAGRTSNTAQVVITVLPRAVADSVSVYKGTSTAINVVGNDVGSLSGAVVNVLTPPGGGSSVASTGTGLTFTAPSTASGTTSFTYSVTDASGGESAAATVTVSFLTYHAPTAVPLVMLVDASATATATTLNAFAQTGMTTNDPGSTVILTSGLAAATGWPTADAGPLVVSAPATLGYTVVPSTIGVYTFTYKVLHPTGSSASSTGKITVRPFGANFSQAVGKKSETTIKVAANSVPSAPYAGMVFSFTAPSCGSLSSIDTTAGSFEFTAPNSKITCTVSYSMSKTLGGTTVTSAPKVISLVVS